MKIIHSTSIASAIVLLSSALTALPAHAVSANDDKTISPTHCTPVGPGTTIDELTINSYGVFNPGASSESVICAIRPDGDVTWTSSAGMDAKLEIFYRAGSVSGKVSCTAYSGSTVVVNGSTYGLTYNPPYQPAGSRHYFFIDLAENSGLYGSAPPTNLLCTLTPKAALGVIYLHEYVATNIIP